MKKYIGFIFIVVGLILVAVGLVWGLKSGSTKELLSQGYTFNYHVTYSENGNIVDTSTYAMVVGEQTDVNGEDCYFIDLSIENEDTGKTGAGRTARTGANTSIPTSVVSGDMWIHADSFDLAKKQPFSLIYGNETYTILNYTYNGSHGAPWGVGKTWTYVTNMNSSTGQSWQIPGSAAVAGTADIVVPAGTFEDCYRVEYTTMGSSAPGLIEWWSEDLGVCVKMMDYSNYTGIETRELESYSMD